MTDTARIIVRVTAEGIVTAETKDITGAKCLHYINILEDLLDAETVSSAYTADYDRHKVIEEGGIQSELHQQ